jgi:glycosyltransferase involved in cell wall biosynthesis
MPPITALLHTFNDERRLGRALETLFPCAEILVIDHHSVDLTARIAGRYGSRLIMAEEATTMGRYTELARHDWIFCLTSSESIAEGLQASLFEWSQLQNKEVSAKSFCVSVRAQIGSIWHTRPPETRLVRRDCVQWDGPLPAHDPSSRPLEGEMLRLAFP